MRIVFSLILAMPIMASAQSNDPVGDIFREAYGLPAQQQAAPVYGLPVQPVLPVPQDRGPWGTGYSVVTTTRPKTNLFDRDMVGSETVQRVVPNDGLGQPMRGLDLQGW
jgi:hypothetical protein